MESEESLREGLWLWMKIMGPCHVCFFIVLASNLRCNAPEWIVGTGDTGTVVNRVLTPGISKG